MAKVLVTGGAGFIGSQVTRQLLDQGHDVILYDSFLTYVYPLETYHVDNTIRRLEGILDRVEVVRGSTQDLDFLGQTLRAHKPTHIIHLAAMPLAKLAIEHPEEALNAIVNGTMNILQVCRDLDSLERFTYVSSSMVYGDFDRIPAHEDDSKTPKEVYGGLKLSGEIITQVYGDLYGVAHSIVRPSAVYGPTDNNRRVIGIFLENALKGLPLRVDGSSTMLDFTYITDIAAGIILAALHPNGAGGIFNMTCGRGRSILDAAEIIKGLVPGVEVIVQEADKQLPKRGALDITRAREELGFEPQVQLEQGIELYFDYLKNQHDAKVG